MSTIDQQFVEYIVKSLVGNPDDVIVERQIDEKGVLLTLTVNPDDLGRVIGRRGATAQSLRTLLRALGTKNSARYNLKIVNNDSEKYVIDFKRLKKIDKICKILVMAKGIKAGKRIYDSLAGYQWLIIVASLCTVYRNTCNAV